MSFYKFRKRHEIGQQVTCTSYSFLVDTPLTDRKQSIWRGPCASGDLGKQQGEYRLVDKGSANGPAPQAYHWGKSTTGVSAARLPQLRRDNLGLAGPLFIGGQRNSITGVERGARAGGGVACGMGGLCTSMLRSERVERARGFDTQGHSGKVNAAGLHRIPYA